ncbi:MAG: LamG domain-containing protein, partial [Nanoarchaeota archaeon]|nr:LamG domain-containing protein [Nanoarchaeota archaeon]
MNKCVEIARSSNRTESKSWDDYSEYGNFYYKRVNIQREEISENRKKWKTLFIFLGILSLILVSSFLIQNQFTGKVILFDKNIFSENETVSGVFEIPIKEGELLSSDSVINVKVGSENKSMVLGELFNMPQFNGEVFYGGSSYGSGSGYGFIGKKTSYPDVKFKLNIIQLSIGNSDIREILGATNYNEPFEYFFDGEAQIVSGSVSDNLNDIQLPDNTLSITQDGNKIIVSTKYSTEEEGFGKDFVGDEKVLNVDLSKFNIRLPSGEYELEASLIHQDQILLSSKQTLTISPSSLKDTAVSELKITDEPLQIQETVVPVLNFTAPTPANGTSTSNTSVEINATIDEENLDTFKFNWNGTNTSTVSLSGSELNAYFTISGLNNLTFNNGSFSSTFYDPSLVFMMNFDNVSAIGENETYAVDISKYGNNGTISVAAWNSSGKYGSAMQFNGIGDYVSANDSSSLDATRHTLAAWVYTSNATRDQGVIYKGTLSNAEGIYSMATFSNKLLCGVDGSWRTQTTADQIQSNTWQFIVCTYNGSDSRAYVNGKLIATGAYTGGSTDNNPVYIGMYYSTSYSWLGRIDEVRIYNRSLSADEISIQYYSNLRKYDSNKWAFYTNQTSGNYVLTSNDGGKSEFAKYNSTRYTFYNNVSNLSVGNYTFSAWANDTAGNANSTGIRSFNIIPPTDTIPPEITIISPLNQTYNVSTIDFNVALNENGSWCGFSLDDAANVSMDKFNDTYFNYTKTGLADGSHNITFSCNDTLGNMVTTDLRYFAVNTICSATGGTITQDGNYTIHTFTSNDTFSVTTGCNVEVLVVAGGGGGGGNYGGGGGGGGGVVYNSTYSVTSSPINVTVGAG